MSAPIIPGWDLKRGISNVKAGEVSWSSQYRDLPLDSGKPERHEYLPSHVRPKRTQGVRFLSTSLAPFHLSTGTAWHAQPEGIINVPVRTLDDLLTEAGAPQPIDFLSVDVEGHETEVLSGFDFLRWAPRLILLEDHVANLRRHRFMMANGYRLVRRTGFNGWYVPAAAPVSYGLMEELRLLRKYYFGLHYRRLRNELRKLYLSPVRQRHAPS